MSNASVSKVPGNAVPIFHVEVYHIRRVMVRFDGYPFSNNNHGSVENHPKWKETNIGDTPIFHDCGRKGFCQIDQVCQLGFIIWSSYLCGGSCVWWVQRPSYIQAHCRLSASKCILLICISAKETNSCTQTNHMGMSYRHVHKRPTKSLTHGKNHNINISYQILTVRKWWCTVCIHKWTHSNTIDHLVKQLHKNNALWDGKFVKTSGKPSPNHIRKREKSHVRL